MKMGKLFRKPSLEYTFYFLKNKIIINFPFSKTFGCGSAIASSSYATEILHGMSIDDAA